MAAAPAKRIDHYRESVWNAVELDPMEKLTLLAMTRWMDTDTLGGCRPGRALIVKRTSLGDRTVRRTIRRVIEKGWLIEERPGGSGKGGKRLAAVYRGTCPDWGQADPSQHRPTGVSLTPVLGSESPRTGVRVTPHPSRDPAAPHGSPAGAGALGRREGASSERNRHPNGCTCFHCHYGTAMARPVPASAAGKPQPR